MDDLQALLSEAQNQVKQAYDACKAEQSGDALGALLEARERLASMQEALLAWQKQRQEREREMEQLRDSVRLAPQLVRHHGVYWRKGDPDPWCPYCWEHDQIAVHLNPTDVLAGRLLSCQRCSYSVNQDFVAPPKKWPQTDAT